MYEPRFYREWQKEDDLLSFQVQEGETDLWIGTKKNLYKEARDSVLKYRKQISSWISDNQTFLSSMVPIPQPSVFCPPIIREMIRTSTLGGVGPMATVAGAIAEFVGRDLSPDSDELIIENGGDIYLISKKERIVGIYAGDNSPFTGKLGLRIKPENTPLGICASSGKIGHSISLGQSDIVITISPSTPLADAAATAVGNLIHSERDIQSGIDFAQKIKGLRGIVLIKDDKMGIWGDIDLTPTQPR